ncbi:MAG: hypothetical protein ACFFDW_06200 [Candidatus Thorarchaeota archaeon]
MSKNTELLLDPEFITENVDSFFVSHAHFDHLPKSRKKPINLPPAICSDATARLFYERIGYKLSNHQSWENEVMKIETIPGGHTFDSSVALITEKETGQKIVYTGDVNVEDRGYLKGFRPFKCDILVLEATWGDRNYQFPSFNHQIELAQEYIETELNKGNPVALLGYSLGKAQLLNHCFGSLIEKRFSSESIWKMEKIHRELGLELFETQKLNLENIISDIPVNEPWLLFHDHSNTSNSLLAHLKKKHNLKIVGFSGWAKDFEQYKYRMGVDAAFIVSDHSDYNSLLGITRL